MVPFGHPVSCPEVRVGRAFRQVPTSAFVVHAGAWIGALLTLLLFGWRVAKTLGSPLPAVMASGMLFLIGCRCAARSSRAVTLLPISPRQK